jgi:hypothetical protein
MSRVLARRDETLERQPGRGIDGRPLKRCLNCGTPIPWPRYDLRATPVSPYVYRKRKFCSIQCSSKFWRAAQRRRRGEHRETPRREGRRQGRVLPPQVRFAGQTLKTIQGCRKCGSRALRFIGIGYSCRLCGSMIYAADGDYSRESRLLAQSDAIDSLG